MHRHVQFVRQNKHLSREEQKCCPNGGGVHGSSNTKIAIVRLSLPIFRSCTLVVFASICAAHYTWVAPLIPLEVGKTATIRINHGHKFPQSEESINAKQAQLFVFTPSGARVDLQPAVVPNALAASYSVKEEGLHRIVFTQDRGITSRTPKGVRQGGRDANPDATQAFRTFRSAVAYVPTKGAPATSAKPIDIVFQLVGEYVNGAWNVRLINKGLPVPDAIIEVFVAGDAKAVQAGKTNADGRITYRPTAQNGTAMFSTEFKTKMPEGTPYDTTNYETSLAVTW